MVILPTQEIINLILRSNLRPAISYCFCRENAKKMGNPCPMNAPVQTCMTLSFPQSIELMNNLEPKQELLAKEKQIYQLLKKCEEIGLVHQAIFYEKNSTYVICNCCPCCCEVLSTHFKSVKEINYHKRKIEIYNELSEKIENNGIKQDIISEQEIDTYKSLKKDIKYHKKSANMEPTPIVVKSIFISQNKKDIQCKNCGICENRCYFGARQKKNGKLQYNSDLCVGCGLCVTTCPEDSIQLIKRKYPKLTSKNKNAIKHKHPHGSL